MPKHKITLVEPHRVKSVWKRPSGAQIMGSVRLNTPLHTQPVLAASLRRSLGDDYEIDIVDSRLIDSDQEQSYRELPYGEGTIEHFRVGMSLEGEKFLDVAKQSDVLGLTVNFTQEAGIATDIALEARRHNPDLKIVFGGSDVRARLDHYFHRAGADAVVIGDGERCGGPLIKALLGHGKLEDVASVAYRDGEQVRHGLPPHRDTVPMEEVPLPAFDLVADDIPKWFESHEGDLPRGVHPPLAYVETSRGCHETCPFCYSAGLRYRSMLSPQIEEYCDHLEHWGIKSLMMIADNELTPMLMHRVKGQEISGRELILERYRILAERGFQWEFSNGLQYSMFSREGLLDEELIETMFSGCYRLFTPVEDPLDLVYDKLYGAPKDRRREPKSADEAFVEHHQRVLARIAATGLPMMTFGLIIGWPGDTVERVQKVADRCKQLRDAIHQANPDCQLLFTPFVGIPIPGTKTWQECQRDGLIHEDVVEHPEAWQFSLTTYGNHEMVDARMSLIAQLDGLDALDEWTATGAYPTQVVP